MRSTLALAATVPLLLGCSSCSSDDDLDCTSHYLAVADAPTQAALKRELLAEIDARTRALRVIEEHPDEGKVYINLLNRKGRNIMSLDMWRLDDGTWTAQQWSQCID